MGLPIGKTCRPKLLADGHSHAAKVELLFNMVCVVRRFLRESLSGQECENEDLIDPRPEEEPSYQVRLSQTLENQMHIDMIHSYPLVLVVCTAGLMPCLVQALAHSLHDTTPAQGSWLVSSAYHWPSNPIQDIQESLQDHSSLL